MSVVVPLVRSVEDDHLCHEMLPDVDGAKANGTFFFASSRCSYALPLSNGACKDNKQRKKKSKAEARSGKGEELSLVVYFRAKCLGGFAEPKTSSSSFESQRHNNDNKSTAVRREECNDADNDAATKPTRGDDEEDADENEKEEDKASLPKRFKRALLRFEFRLPDIQLPSIPLPSLPTFSIPSWTATDPEQLHSAEKQLMDGCAYGQAHVAGLNTFMPVHILRQRKRLLRSNAKQAAAAAAAAADCIDAATAQGASNHRNGEEACGAPLPLSGSVSNHSSSSSPSSCRESSCGALDTPIGSCTSPPQLLPKSEREIVVLIHGFGGGSAMWAQNWNAIAADADVYAFDLPGFARSHREVESFTDVHLTIQYYCSKFVEWFHEMQFDRPVILCGHSFGGYLAAFFTMHLVDVEQRSVSTEEANVVVASSVVKHLVLADPWGIELLPRAFMKEEIKSMSTRDRLITKLFHHFTPLGGLRAAGPIGPKLVPAIRPDLAEGWTGLSRKRFFKYIYHCNAQEPPSGELAFRTCVAYAGHPRVAAGPVLRERLPESIALTAMYGNKTMMDAHAGWHLIAALWKRGHRRCRWVEISDAGHQIFSENAKEFNHEMRKVIRAEEEERRRQHVIA